MTADVVAPTPARYRWVVLVVATFTQAAAGFFVQGIGALGIPLQRDLGLSAAQLGLLISAAQLAPLVGLLVAGELIDRVDERWVVSVGAGVVGGALVAGTLAPGYAALVGVLLVVGAGYSTVQPGGSKSVAAWFDASRRGTAMGIRQAGLPLGAALASAALPAVADGFGWRATLAVGGAVALLGAAAFAILYRRPSERLTAPREVGTRLALLREPAMLRALLCGVSMISVQCGLGLLPVLHLHELASLTPRRAAVVLVALQGAGVAGRICLAAISDRVRWRRQSIVVVSMVAVAAALALLMTPIGRSPQAACALFVWLGFFGIGWYGPWVALLTEAAPAGRTGFALGLAMAVNQVAIVLAPPLLGLLRDVTGGFSAPWGVLVATTCVALAGTCHRRRPGQALRSGVRGMRDRFQDHRP